MALIDYNYRYFLPFKDVDGNQWRVRIFDRDEAGSVERLIGTGNPVEIYYEADETMTKGIIGSECSINVYGVPNDYGGSNLSQFFTPDEERFLVQIEWLDTSTGIYNLYWRGFLHQDEYIEHIAYDPYEVNLVALDRLGTIKDSMDSLGYKSDDKPILSSILQDFIDLTKLELTLEVDSGLVVEGQDNASDAFDLLQVSAQTFFTEEDEFVEMESINDVVSAMALSGFCRVWQQEGKLMFKRVLFNPLSNDKLLSYPDDVLNIGSNLKARHITSTRATNISIACSSKNLLTNPSFEADSVGDTTPTGWVKPSSNTQATIEVSDETVDKGSLQSLKTVNNRISDSTFDGASLADKLGRYTLVETTSDDIFIEDFFAGAIRAPRLLVGRNSFRFFINNTFDATYELRVSLQTKFEDGGADVYYDFDNGTWTTSFKHAFLNANTNGEWQEASFDFTMWSFDFGLTRTAPIVMRIHTMNYNQSLSDVEIFYDNFVFQLYTGSGATTESILADTKFYNLSSINDASNQTDATDVELLMGVTYPDFTVGLLAPSPWELFYKKLKGLYFIDSVEDYLKVSFDNQVLNSNLVYRSLQQTLLRMRKFYDSRSKRIYSATLATKRVEGAGGFIALPIPQGDNSIIFNDMSDSGMPFDEESLSFSITASFVDDSNAKCVFLPNFVPPSGTGIDYKLRVKTSDMGNNSGQSITVRLVRRSDNFVYGSQTVTSANEGIEVELTTSYLGGEAINIEVIGNSSGQSQESFGLDYIYLDGADAQWSPINFGDRFVIDLNSYTGAQSVFTRFSADLKENRYEIDAAELPNYTQNDPIPLPPSG